MKIRQQWISFVGVVLLAVALPGILQFTNRATRWLAGAEGRLAAIAVETNHPLGPMPKPWKAMAQGGDELKTFLDGNRETVSRLGLEYIRIDHIFDQFGVVNRSEEKLTMNWIELDSLVTKILNTGAKPFFVLSYMPEAISTKTEVDEPRSWSEWMWVVQKTIEHYSGDLGITGVYYEVWNEPDLFGKWTMGGKKDYRNLYLYSSRGAEKAVGYPRIKEFKFGGPATTGLYRSWMDGFFPFVLQNRLRLDFFSWHRYDLNLDKYVKDVQDVDVWLDKHPYFSSVEKIISEWGPNSQMGKENDTHLGAAHLVAVVREMLAKIKYGFTFAISGNWGVLNKPRYDALEMLNRLGNERLGITGEGSWVRAVGAKEGNKYQVLVVNYDPKEVHSELVPVSFINLVKNQKYDLYTSFFRGDQKVETVATSEAILQRSIWLPANSMALVELKASTP